MEYILISIIALSVSALTLFSGFGLGTLLMPAFIIFFPPEVAIAATAVVHFLNNIFKFILVGKKAELRTTILFALPAAIFAIAGAYLLTVLTDMRPPASYQIGDHLFEITYIKLVIALLMFFFAVGELSTRVSAYSFDKKYISLGGVLSGFFGGLSGHQGALRSAFLLRSGLDKDSFIGTSVLSAIIVDAVRLSIYGTSILSAHFKIIGNTDNLYIILAGTASAFAGSFIGSRLIKKVTLRNVQVITGGLLFLTSILLGFGII